MSTSHPSQEPLKPFYKQWSFWFIFLYLLCIAIYTAVFILSDGKNVPLSSNELGDFLAGSFAPLAFLFLYLGYKRQGEELKQNTKALEQQATELANSVAEQKRLIELHKDEQTSKHFAAKPFLEMFTTSFRLYSEPYEITDENDIPIQVINREYCEFILVMENKGECSKQVSIFTEQGKYIVDLYELNKNEEYKKIIYLLDSEINLLNTNKYLDKKYEVKYHDIYGKKYSKSIKIEIKWYEPEDEYYLTTEILSFTPPNP